MRVGSRNAAFQQWQALLTNRTKRQRAGEFLVQGVRPVTLAVSQGWEVRAFLCAERLSRWARSTVDAVPAAERHLLAPELLAELSDKDAAELVAVVGLPPDRLDRIPLDLVVVFDRPSTPGNIGTLIRSADAFGASGLVVTGHAADPYDPRSVRASTGSLFALPVVRVPSHREVLDWAAGARVVGTDETGAVELAAADLTGPTVLLVGSETAGLSAAWREAADTVVRIPIAGTASSLNAAAAGSIALYEAARQRARAT